MMKSSLIRINLIFILFVLFIPNFTSAELKTFIKEYTYQASEDDSRNSSRTLALREVKRLLLEELGTYLESITEVQNFRLTKDQITTLTAGIVKTEIVDEKWDGRTYWLKSKIVADSIDVIKTIDALRKDRVKTRELEELRKRSEDLLKENERLRKELTVAKGKKRQKTIATYDENIKYLTANEWFEKGYASHTSGNYNDAIDAYSEVVVLSPKSVPAYYNRGLAYADLGKYKESIKDFSTAIELNPKLAEAYCARGLAYYRLGNNKQAIQDYNKAIELNQKYIPAYYNRGLVYSKLGNDKQAIQDYNRAIELNPKLAEAYCDRGVAYGNLGQHQRAIEDYTQAIRLKPGDAYAHYNRGLAHYSLGQHQRAIEDYNEAIRLKPDFVELYVFRGGTYSFLGQHQRAIEDYTQAIRLKSDFTEAYTLRGATYNELGQYQRAIGDYNEAIRLKPADATAYKGRGVAYVHLSQYKNSRADFDEAIRLKPNDNDTYYNYACSFSLQKDAKQACVWLTWAIERGFKNWKHMEADKDLDNIRNEECFVGIIKDSLQAIEKTESAENADDPYKGIKAIVLKNGNVIEGKILRMDPDIVKIRTKDGKVLSYDFKKEVETFITK